MNRTTTIPAPARPPANPARTGRTPWSPPVTAAGVPRFRPWTVGRFFNRALTYGALTFLIGACYVFGVARIDALFGLDSDWLAPPQVAAAGLVALAFHPARVLAEKWADRLVHGRRVPPYEVLAQASALSWASGPGAAALVSLAEVVAKGLGVGHATVHLDLRDGTQETYRWPPEAASPSGERTIPVVHRGVVVGALGIPAGAGRMSAPHQSELVDVLARSAGVLLHNASLSVELEHQLRGTKRREAEIRASRWRIVAAQDSERRELERDLHDGAQPALTAVRLSLGLVAHLARSGKHTAAREALGRLRDQIDNASAGLRQTLRGLEPPTRQEGIVAALRELAESLGTEVAFTVGTETQAARFGPHIEAAVYFCCAEALQNTVKHSPGAPVSVTLGLDRAAEALRFAVTDQGPGFDATAVPDGSGLQNMADRITAVGGRLTIVSKPGEGTEVSGSVPAPPRG